MKIEHLRECVVLSETLSFSETAERTYTTQPAVSRHVVQVENELGIKLFERTTRGVSATAAGKIALDGFRTAVDVYDRACRDAIRAARGIKGTLSISSPYYWTEKYTEPLVRILKAAVPECEAQLIACQPIEGFEQMARGESDIALSIAMKELPEGISCAPFAQEPLAVMMCVDNPLASRESVRLEELDFNTFVTLDRKRYAIFETPHAATAEGATAGRDGMAGFEAMAKNIVEVEQIEMVALAVQQTGGISILPYEARRMDRSYIRTVRIENPGVDLTLCHYWRTDNGNPLLRIFLDLAKNESIDPIN